VPSRLSNVMLSGLPPSAASSLAAKQLVRTSTPRSSCNLPNWDPLEGPSKWAGAFNAEGEYDCRVRVCWGRMVGSLLRNSDDEDVHDAVGVSDHKVGCLRREDDEMPIL